MLHNITPIRLETGSGGGVANTIPNTAPFFMNFHIVVNLLILYVFSSQYFVSQCLLSNLLSVSYGIDAMLFLFTFSLLKSDFKAF